MPSNVEILTALALQIENELASEIEGLQVYPLLLEQLTPPSIDMYPSTPHQEGIGMGAGVSALYFDVRARLNTTDLDAAQIVLLAMMDPTGSASLEQAILSDRTLNGVVGTVALDGGAQGYGVHTDPLGQGSWLGCVWRVQVIP